MRVKYHPALALLVVLAVSCAHNQKEAAATRPDATSTPGAGAASLEPAPAPAPTPKPAVAACDPVRVHFGFDDATLAATELPILQGAADCLNARRDLRVLIQGNADERGTTEYNLALGDRRATAVERYLSSLGVSRDQLRTVSYGKEQPLCTEHDEACWAKNRRAAIERADASR
jgi:peptidoglycan-associated lipoprotein